MSVLIKGMEMPTSCRACMFSRTDIRNVDWCVLTEKDLPCDCPLVPVPPHGDLIDRDALMKMCGMATDCYDCPNGEHGWCKRSQDAANICEAIEDAPTIIPASEEGET
jgi:hypothetical protein